MNFQYTVYNTGLPGCPVVIRTKIRGIAASWVGGHYRVVPRCLDRAKYGLANTARRLATPHQYAFWGDR